MALSSQLQNQVRNYFSRSRYFDSNESLHGLFIDQRISAWRNNVPESSSKAGRIANIIAQFDTMNGEYNTLALIIQVISDNTPHGDAMKGEGVQLAHQVQSGSTASKQAEYEREIAQLEEHFRRGWADAAYYNKRKPQLLALIAQFDTPQDIPASVGVSPMVEQRLREEFDASAKQLIAWRELMSVYSEFGVGVSGLLENMMRAHESCKQLAAQINAL